MSKNVANFMREAINQAERSKFFKTTSPLTINDGPTDVVVFFRISKKERPVISEIGISSKGASRMMKQNFTVIERLLYGKQIMAVCSEVIITFINKITEAADIFPEKFVKDWEYLYTNKVSRNTPYYKCIQNGFIDFIKSEIIPNVDGKMETSLMFPYNSLNTNVNSLRRRRLYDIFSNVLFQELKRTIGCEI